MSTFHIADDIVHGYIVFCIIQVSRFQQAAFGIHDGVSQDGSHQTYRAVGIIVGCNGIGGIFGIAVGIQHRKYRNAQFLGFGHGIVLFSGIDHDHGIRQFLHFLDAAQACFQFGLFLQDPGLFFLCVYFQFSAGFHFLDLNQTLYTLLDGAEVGQQTAKPALVYIEGSGAQSLLFHSFCCLLLRAHKQNLAAALADFLQGVVGVFDLLLCLVQIDDIHAIAASIDIRFHFGVPATCLVSEVDAVFQHLPDGYDLCHLIGSFPLFLRQFQGLQPNGTGSRIPGVCICAESRLLSIAPFRQKKKRRIPLNFLMV